MAELSKTGSLACTKIVETVMGRCGGLPRWRCAGPQLLCRRAAKASDDLNRIQTHAAFLRGAAVVIFGIGIKRERSVLDRRAAVLHVASTSSRFSCDWAGPRRRILVRRFWFRF